MDIFHYVLINSVASPRKRAYTFYKYVRGTGSAANVTREDRLSGTRRRRKITSPKSSASVVYAGTQIGAAG